MQIGDSVLVYLSSHITPPTWFTSMMPLSCLIESWLLLVYYGASKVHDLHNQDGEW
jgi:hypothetical protein